VTHGCRYACRGGAPGGGRPAGADPAPTLAFLRAAFPRLVAHYGWFKATQAGRAAGSFRWRGATRDHSFASGLDDYPRGVVPSHDDESADLLAWMAMAAHVLADLADAAGDGAGGGAGVAAAFAADAAAHTARLGAVHWDDAAAGFCDVGVTEVVPPPPPAAGAPPRRGPPPAPTLVRGRVCHVGYVTALPVLLRLLPADDPRVAAALAPLTTRAAMASPYGLRSLSASDPEFGAKEDYWRGAVWLNMNYLAVAALRHYGAGGGPAAAAAAAAADDLARRVVGAVAAEYRRTGFVWENYDSRTGRGRGTHPFTGWSALVALLAAGRFPF
jgi:mannosyl-oligosaccharide glucosidase